ncbi:MAG: DNA polymerase I [Culturomica sp.]|jgi:DNA polymerase-1|nr:DNA polymerase I [Culturomica sp.]
MKTPTLYLVDAYALIYRSYYAFINNPRITTTGINTSATFGFCNFITELLQQEKPDYIAVVFDPEGTTFRHEMYDAYKAHRPKMPEDLKKSIPYIKKIMNGLGIRAVEVSGYEADDVIGTLAVKGEKEGCTVYMITPDKDYAQIVSENIFMYKPGRAGNKSEIWGISEVLDRFGIERISQVVDILGLMGDAADNVPGCDGIGSKTASLLVSKYGSIEGIYEHIDELKGKQRENLLTCQPTVNLSKTLVTINTEVPLDVEPSELVRKPVEKSILEPIVKELELFSLSRKWFDEIEDIQVVASRTSESVKTYYRDMTDNIDVLKETLLSAKEYSFFMKSPSNGSLYNSQPTLLCFSTAPNTAMCVRCPQNPEKVATLLDKLDNIFSSDNKFVISDDIKNLFIWFKVNGHSLNNQIFDIKIAHYVLHPDQSHELSRMALQYLNYRMDEKQTNKQQQLTLFFDDESEETDCNFAEESADLIFQLKEKLKKDLQTTGLQSLFDNVEMPLVPVLADMEFEGVYINKEELHRMSGNLRLKTDNLEQEIYSIAKHPFNISSPKQLGEVLFDEMKLDAGNKKTKTGQYSTSEQVLVKMAADNLIIQKILDYRGLKKLYSTYTEALPTFIEPKTGKIHTCFNQTETATGRLSSLNPNLQNIPIRTEEGRQIRKAFITNSPDYMIFTADYSQVELRIMAHLSQTTELIEAFKNDIDIHAATAAKIYHVALDEVTPEMRRRAKTANFGIIYGISAWGLAERLQISRKEGKELIDGYFNLYPGVKNYMEESIEKARKKEYVETIMGRRRYLRDINSRNAVIRGMAERNAINAPIQGSAADIIKLAMICIHRKILEAGMKSKMILQVHDELDFKCHRTECEQLEQLVKDCMENVVNLSVPLTVSTGFGENWYEAH